jgi:hypothetical protein
MNKKILTIIVCCITVLTAAKRMETLSLSLHWFAEFMTTKAGSSTKETASSQYLRLPGIKAN